MKRNFLIAGAITAVCLSASVTFYTVSDRSLDIMDFNVEALASPEGTKIKECHIAGSGSSGFKLECPRNTSTSMIYPCPHTKTFIYSELTFYCVDE